MLPAKFRVRASGSLAPRRILRGSPVHQEQAVWVQVAKAPPRGSPRLSRGACKSFRDDRFEFPSDGATVHRKARAYDLVKSKSLWRTFKEVYVIVYGNDASAEGTGVHSLWRCDGAHCSNTVVSFADFRDAERYLEQVRIRDERPASLHSITPQQLVAFCQREGYHCQLEMPGSKTSPPEEVVDVTDWERDVALHRAASTPTAPKPATPSLPEPHPTAAPPPRNLPPIPGLSPFRHMAARCARGACPSSEADMFEPAASQALRSKLPLLDVAISRGGEASDLRSRDLTFEDWALTAASAYTGENTDPAGIPPHESSMPKLMAEAARVRDVFAAARKNPGWQRTTRVFGREMYLPGMAPTSDDDADLLLLEHLWDISGDVGDEGEAPW